MGEATLKGKAEVLAAMAAHTAVRALEASLGDRFLDACFDRQELTLTVAPEAIEQAANAVKEAGYNFLEDVAAVDWLPAEPRFEVCYHILSHALKERIRLRAFLGGAEPSIATVTPVWPSANFFEREIFDLFGIDFAGHPNQRRILMPDEWQGHPLRKDYPVEGYR